MNERIKTLRTELKMSQQKLGEWLGLSKSGVSEIESGRRNVTEQHIIMLKSHNVNETWLRTGVGDMMVPIDRESDIAKLSVDLLTEESDSFKNRLISALARLSVEEWELLEKMFSDVVDKKNE